MPLSRPRASSLQLSLSRTTWRPSRPPTPRRAPYSPGTTSRDIPSLDVPPVPPLSYWEPETPSPMTTCNPFLSPPTATSAEMKVGASPLLSGSLLMFDGHTGRAWMDVLRGEMSPRFLNPRTAPLPPAVKEGRRGIGRRRHSGVSSVLEGELGRMGEQVLGEIIARVQERVREETKRERERDEVGADKELDFGYNTVNKRRQRRNLVKTKAFHVLKHVAVKV